MMEFHVRFIISEENWSEMVFPTDLFIRKGDRMQIDVVGDEMFCKNNGEYVVADTRLVLLKNYILREIDLVEV